MNKNSKKQSRFVPRIIAFAAAVAAVIIISRFYDIRGLLETFLDRVAGMGLTGAIILALVYIGATVLFVPGSILTLGAGAFYGVVFGTILVSIASTLGAAAAFLAGRYIARDWVAGWVSERPRFRAIDEAVGREGWKIVILTRLSPIFPFNLLNYAYGLTRVRLIQYVVASWAGMIPGTLMYVYLGSLAGDLATIGEGGRGRSALEWALYALGFAATALLTIYVTRIARRALDHRVSPGERE